MNSASALRIYIEFRGRLRRPNADIAIQICITIHLEFIGTVRHCSNADIFYEYPVFSLNANKRTIILIIVKVSWTFGRRINELKRSYLWLPAYLSVSSAISRKSYAIYIESICVRIALYHCVTVYHKFIGIGRICPNADVTIRINYQGLITVLAVEYTTVENQPQHQRQYS